MDGLIWKAWGVAAGRNARNCSTAWGIQGNHWGPIIINYDGWYSSSLCGFNLLTWLMIMFHGGCAWFFFIIIFTKARIYRVTAQLTFLVDDVHCIWQKDHVCWMTWTLYDKCHGLYGPNENLSNYQIAFWVTVLVLTMCCFCRRLQKVYASWSLVLLQLCVYTYTNVLDIHIYGRVTTE